MDYFHTTHDMVCFMKNEIRKCAICKTYIDIIKDHGIFFMDGNSYLHTACFIKYKTGLKRGAWSTEQCKSYIDPLLETTNQNIRAKIIRKQVTDWLFETYDVSFLPTYIYTKLDSIYNGTFKGLSKPIPPEDLLDMWQRKKDYLNKVYIKNQSAGKIMDAYGRINYDVAIILSKYDSYSKWKEEQEFIRNEIVKRTNEEAHKINYNVIKTVQGSSKIDISDLIDDI